MIKINSNNIDKNIKMYYNKLNMYTERVLEVPHSGTSFFAAMSFVVKLSKSGVMTINPFVEDFTSS